LRATIINGRGSHDPKLRLWKSADLAPDKDKAWYRNLGQGMGATLNIAAAMNASFLLLPKAQ
jgi:ABC-type tungstate transport system permease subunit